MYDAMMLFPYSFFFERVKRQDGVRFHSLKNNHKTVSILCSLAVKIAVDSLAISSNAIIIP